LQNVPEEIDYLALNAADLSNKAAKDNWDIQTMRRQILLAEAGRKAQVYGNYTPSLFLSWSLGRTILDPFKENWGKWDNWTTSGALSFGLSFKLDSLLPWSSGAQKAKDIEDQTKLANLQLAQKTQEAIIEINTNVFSLEKIRAQSEVQQQTVDLAERSYRLTEQAYRGGLKQLLEVQTAEQDLRQARLDMLRQNIDYLKGILDLEYAIGVPFGTLGGRN
jgi:outer membrane protein TolC